ncbi:MAG TPA: WhiB family transcriptional regulator [Acidimicrobiales bacterium]|nr:WhiB family transcriptional regulator [Acidimicrobiales bacterium]
MSVPVLLPTDWTSRAACRGCPSEKFFPATEDPAEAAKVICRGCPVQGPCLDHAMRYREAGVWGGTTERERARIRRATPGRGLAPDNVLRVAQPHRG